MVQSAVLGILAPCSLHHVRLLGRQALELDSPCASRVNGGDMSDRERLVVPVRTAVATTVNLLVDRSYQTLASMTRGRWLTAQQLQEGVDEYGRMLVRVPESDLDDLDVVQMAGSEPATFHVVVPLWTDEEGRSDLALELRLVENFPDALSVEVTDLHVL